MTKKFIILTIIALGLASTPFFLLPGIKDLGSQLATAFCFAIFVFEGTAIWFFLTSLRAFKKQLKIAYYTLATGIFLFGLAQVPLALGPFVNLDPTVDAAFIVLPALFGAMVMYLGVRKFARILDIHSRWRSFLTTTGLALIFVLVIIFMPHSMRQSQIPIVVIDVVFGIYVAGAIYSLSAGMLALRIKKQLSLQYQRPLNLLVIALIIASFTSFHEITVQLVPIVSDNMPQWFFDFGLNLWPSLLTSIALALAGIAFKQTSQQLGVLPENASYLDVITYTAQLASSPAAIDPTLDQVREITAAHSSTELSKTDKTRLVDVYLKIEDYLINQEPLRKFTKQDLRIKLPEDFQQALPAG